MIAGEVIHNMISPSAFISRDLTIMMLTLEKVMFVIWYYSIHENLPKTSTMMTIPCYNLVYLMLVTKPVFIQISSMGLSMITSVAHTSMTTPFQTLKYFITSFSNLQWVKRVNIDNSIKYIYAHGCMLWQIRINNSTKPLRINSGDIL